MIQSIIGSDIFEFVIGPHSKKFSIHGAAISGLSKPLNVLLNGRMREAIEKRVRWPDVDEKTFVRFSQWAYTGDYVTEEPDIVLDYSLIEVTSSANRNEVLPEDKKATEKPLYSLTNIKPTKAGGGTSCADQTCGSFGKSTPSFSRRGTCPVCKQMCDASACAIC